MVPPNSVSRGQHPNSRANLRPWKPGTQPNPHPSLAVTNFLKQLLREKNYAEARKVASAWLETAASPKEKNYGVALVQLLDRTEGKVEVSNPQVNVSQIKIIFQYGGQNDKNDITIETTASSGAGTADRLAPPKNQVDSMPSLSDAV